MENQKIQEILTGFNDSMRTVMTTITTNGEVTEPISEDIAEFIFNSWNETVEKLGNIGIELKSEI